MIKDDTTPDTAGATTEVTITDGLTRDVFGFKTGTMLDNTEVRVTTDSHPLVTISLSFRLFWVELLGSGEESSALEASF